MRDHLFISYATEDVIFVDWLALRLTAEGHKVWWDRLKLLGGESYPQDINEAIKNQSFRFITVLSRHSINKANPLKERTLALTLAKEQKNFIIPINLDGLSTSDLNWMISDLTFIPFHLDWAEGLAQLLKLLERDKAPRELANGRSIAASWFETKGLVVPKEERLWSNVVKISELPEYIYRYETRKPLPDEERLDLLKLWPHVSDGQVFWSFFDPPAEFRDKHGAQQFGRREWNSTNGHDAGLDDLAKRILNQALITICLARGLKLTDDGSHCYFPDKLTDKNRLAFKGYDNKWTWVRSVGTRNFRTQTHKEACVYHLAPAMRVWLDHELGDLVQIRVRLFLTTPEGVTLDPKASLARRKRICRSWWNYHWLARISAILQFLANDKSSIELGEGQSHRLTISKQPLVLEVNRGIDESRLGKDSVEPADSDEAILELDEDRREEAEGSEE